MTGITDADAAEVLWAGSEQGKAALKAGLGVVFERIGEWSSPANARDITLSEADVAAIVYAACRAAGWDAEPMEDAEPEPAHLHSWAVAGVRQFGKTLETLLNVNPARTIALMRCRGCGDVTTRTLPGSWTLEDLQKGGQP